jgi:hypothetical protein
MDLREAGWSGMDWIYLAQDGDRRMRALVNTIMNLLFHTTPTYYSPVHIIRFNITLPLKSRSPE